MGAILKSTVPKMVSWDAQPANACCGCKFGFKVFCPLFQIMINITQAKIDMLYIEKPTWARGHVCLEIWNFSSSVQLDNSRVSAANQ